MAPSSRDEFSPPQSPIARMASGFPWPLRALSALAFAFLGPIAPSKRTISFTPQRSVELDPEESVNRRTGSASIVEAANTNTRLMVPSQLDPADAAFLDPLFSRTSDRPHEQQRSSVAPFGISDGHINAKVFTSKHTCFPEVKGQPTRVLFSRLRRHRHSRVSNTVSIRTE